jgi:hypothetical protein
MKHKLIINSLLSVFLFFCVSGFEQNCLAKVLTGENYCQSVHEYFSKAEKSISVAMYFI